MLKVNRTRAVTRRDYFKKVATLVYLHIESYHFSTNISHYLFDG